MDKVALLDVTVGDNGGLATTPQTEEEVLAGQGVWSLLGSTESSTMVTLPRTGDSPRIGADGRPNPDWVRGKCPDCGDDLVSNMYYIGGRGYVLAWECWTALTHDNADCAYRRVL